MPAAEMKHGPIALIDENMPVVVLAPRDELYEKMLNNLNEVKARGGIVLAVATEGDEKIATLADDVVYVPEASPMITPMLLMITPMLPMMAPGLLVARVGQQDYRRASERGTRPTDGAR